MKWKEGKNITVKIVKKKNKKKGGEKKTKEVKEKSFFNFFKEIEIDSDNEDEIEQSMLIFGKDKKSTSNGKISSAKLSVPTSMEIPSKTTDKGSRGTDVDTDFAEEDEIEEGKMLWDNQISSLKQVLGSR